MFLERDVEARVKAYSLFGRCGKCSCLRAILLTVMRVVSSIVRLSEDVPYSGEVASYVSELSCDKLSLSTIIETFSSGLQLTHNNREPQLSYDWLL